MKRAQRKTNLKKLQAQNGNVEKKHVGEQEGRRQLRSAKTSALAGITNYLTTDKDTVRNEVVQVQCDSSERAEKAAAGSETSPAHVHTLKRSVNLTRFIYKDKKDRPPQVLRMEHDSDDFETPVKKIKRAPKLSQATVTAKTSTTNNVRKPKRQQKITTAFLRNEQMFSEVAAQHSIAENFNPDEVQLALALSRSEVETIISSKSTADESKEATVSVEEDIRSKLKKFGFRTAAREDYTHCFAAAFLNGQRRTKTKWANKFTALTLRNPTLQSKKLDARIEAILKKQFQTQPINTCDQIFEPYQVHSCTLSHHAVVDKTAQIFRNMETLPTTQHLEQFFVSELFPVTQIPAGHLLKDWTIIPGRDISPDRRYKRLSAEARRYQKFYEELEACFSKNLNDHPRDSEELVSTLEKTQKNDTNAELDCLLELISGTQKDCEVEDAVNLNQEHHVSSQKMVVKNSELQPTSSTDNLNDNEIIVSILENSQNKELVPFTDLRCEVEGAVNLASEHYLSLTQAAVENDILKPTPNTETFLNTQTQVRPTSPDLFADSESDNAEDVEENRLSNITTYEVYSSDDVKTSSEAGCKTDLLSVKADTIVDLTQDDTDTLHVNHSVNLKMPTPQKHEVSKRLDFLDIPNDRDFSFLDASPTPLNETEDNHNKAILCNALRSRTLNESVSKEPNHSCFENSILDLNKSHSIVKDNINQELKEDNHNPILYRNSSIASIDLTQSDAESTDGCGDNDNNNDNDKEEEEDDAEDDDDVCILLSDDEVNYSIIKADKIFSKSESSIAISDNSCEENVIYHHENENSSQKAEEHDFSLLDFIDLERSFQVNEKNDSILPKTDSFDLSGDIEPINKEFLASQLQAIDYPTTPIKNRSIGDMLKQQRAEFGILESQSEPFSQTPPHWTRTPVKVTSQKKVSPASTPGSHELQQQRYSRRSYSRKFQSFLFEAPKTPSRNVFNAVSDEYDDFDEFDRLVYGSPPKRVQNTVQHDVPAGLTQLLTAEISLDAQCVTTSTGSPASEVLKAITPEKAAKIVTEEEIKVNDHVYTVRVTSSPKPNFAAQSDAELLKQLYNFGIKALKRSQAIKLLEYIYNETHPIITMDEGICNERQTEVESEDKADPFKDKGYAPDGLCSEIDTVVEENCGKTAGRSKPTKFNLQDSSGDLLLRFTSELCAELRNDEEVYMFQTNITKKTQQPLLPLHIAWYNLVCSNAALHESILMYEPIDLQEIYLFLKSIGYRYDPKDLKSFFDRRCIIFRYDLTPPEKQANRHIRRPSKKTTNNTQKGASSQRTLHKYLNL